MKYTAHSYAQLIFCYKMQKTVWFGTAHEKPPTNYVHDHYLTVTFSVRSKPLDCAININIIQTAVTVSLSHTKTRKFIKHSCQLTQY